jgi:enoyl-CoA hydratase/carnithine racemase
MPSYETLKIETRGAVQEILLDRPETRNAINLLMDEELSRALDAAEADPAIRAVTIRGAGAIFSAGHDLKEFAEIYLAGGDAIGRPELPELPRPWYFSKALLAGVHGYVGPEANRLVASCDFVIAAEDTRFSFEQARMGSSQPMDPIVSFALPMGVVKKLWLMGGWFDAASALQWQYVQRVVPLDQVAGELRRWAEQAALVPAERYAAAKQEMRRQFARRGLVPGTEMRRHTRDPKREGFYRTLVEKGMRAALKYRDTSFDSDVSKV